ncbi:MAG TPA: hypothetical protein IGR64_00435 [Leptolyngbyaceae cyanobacterium M65_K2018_010]|nr:hypothetical protein [Leptolyngbyaceae cyanobacterium M65_K2018_010]
MTLLLVGGCQGTIQGYRSASAISQDGFARNSLELEQLQGQNIKVWGFVDHSNIYGDEGTKAILGDWWSGEGPDEDTWRFNVMAKAGDRGRSFAVHIPNDQGRDQLLRAFLADANAQRPTRVFVTGKLVTFEAPTNIATLRGLYLEVPSSRDILLEPPLEKEG